MMATETRFKVHLKGGDILDAATSFVVSGVDDNGVTTASTVFKTYDRDNMCYCIVTVDNNNIEYIVEKYTEDAWERLLEVANMETIEDPTATNTLFG